MDELLTYSLRDFLLFSQESYLYMLAQYNQQLWPGHILATLLGVFCLWLCLQGIYTRVLAYSLAGAYFSVAYWFFYQTYMQINWFIEYVVYAFALQGLLLMLLPAVKQKSNHQGSVLAKLMAFYLGLILFVYPLLAFIAYDNILLAESFALMPDPTALLSLALMPLLSCKFNYSLLPLPILWLSYATMTAYSLQQPLWFVSPALALCILGSQVAVRLIESRR